MKIHLTLLFTFILFIFCDKITDLSEMEEFNGDDKEQNLLNSKVDLYIEKNFKDKKEISDSEFIEMFIKVITDGNSKKNSTIEQIAKKILEEKGTPILLQNIHKYFNLFELTFLYDELAKDVESDL